MAKVKFGTSQMGTPPPRGYRRFENAYVAIMVPAFIATAMGWGIESQITITRILLVIGLSASLVKGIGFFLGNGQEYAYKDITEPEDEVVNETDNIEQNINNQ